MYATLELDRADGFVGDRYAWRLLLHVSTTSDRYDSVVCTLWNYKTVRSARAAAIRTAGRLGCEVVRTVGA